MKRSLIIGLYLIAVLFPLSACKTSKTVQLYDVSRVPPAKVARVYVPSNIEILRVDGRKLDFSYPLTRYQYEIQLGPGTHEWIVRYNDLWEYDTNRNFEKLRSHEIALTFKAEPAHHYNVTHPALRELKDAQKFAENPEIWVEEVETKAKVSSSRKYEEDAVYTPVEPSEPTPKTKSTAPSADSGDASLKKDWESMSEEEKKKFKEWKEKERNK